MAMIICPECKKEISDKSEVCINCGCPIATKASDVACKRKLNKKTKVIIGAVIGLISIIVVLISIIAIVMNDPVNKYIKYMKKGDVESAEQLYLSEIADSEKNKEKLAKEIDGIISGIVDEFLSQDVEYEVAKTEILKYESTEPVKDKVNEALNTIRGKYVERLTEEANCIQTDYFDKKIQYDEAISKLDEIKESGLIADTVSNIKKAINDDKESSDAYEKGKEYYQNNELENALEEFIKVGEKNSNYTDAQLKIGEIKSLYEQQIVSEAKALENTNLDSALSKVNKAIGLIGSTETLSGLKSDYTKRIQEEKERKEAERIEQLKNSQEIVVLGIKVDGPGFLNSNDVYVTVKNQSNKYVKEYRVCMLVFDKNGYPLVPSYNSNNIEYGKAVKTLAPGEVYGNSSYWTIFCAEKMNVKACVVSAEYQDGSIWKNEYYDIWLQQNKEKY